MLSLNMTSKSMHITTLPESDYDDHQTSACRMGYESLQAMKR